MCTDMSYLFEAVNNIARYEIGRAVNLMEADKKKKSKKGYKKLKPRNFKQSKEDRIKELEKRREERHAEDPTNTSGRNPNVSKSLENSLRVALRSPGIDLAQIAADMWPHTKPVTRQSKLRKKVEGETTPDGKHKYHFRQEDVRQLYRSKEFKRLRDKF